MTAIDELPWPELTAGQRRFVTEFCANPTNATTAAIRAGYGAASAGVTACRLLAKPQVQAAVEMRLEEYRRETEVQREQLIAELANIVFFGSIGDTLGQDPRDLPPALARCIRKYKYERGPDGTVRATVEMYDRIQAMALLAKLCGLEPAQRHRHELHPAPQAIDYAAVGKMPAEDAAQAYAQIMLSDRA